MYRKVNLSKSSPNLFKSTLVIEHQLMRRQYLMEIVNSLELEKEELEKVRTLLITYEYNFQFYELLILFFKMLIHKDKSLRTLQKDTEIMAVLALIKNKEILLNDSFVRKCINCTIDKFVRFFIMRKNATRLAARVEKKAIEDYYKVINELNKKVRKNTEQNIVEDSVEQHNDELLKKYEELMNVVSKTRNRDFDVLECIPSISEILSASDVIDNDSICNVMVSTFAISRIDMLMVKYIIFGSNSNLLKSSFLFSQVKHSFKTICSEITCHVFGTEACQRTKSDTYKTQLYGEFSLTFKNVIKIVMSAENICNAYTKIYQILSSRFRTVGKEIEFFLVKILMSCKKRDIEGYEKRIVKFLYNNQFKSIYAIITKEYNFSNIVCEHEGTKAIVKSLCDQRSDIIDQMCNMKKLLFAAENYKNILVDFLLSDFVQYDEEIASRVTWLKRMRKSIKSPSGVNSSTLLILKQDVQYIDGEIQKLKENLEVLVSQICNNSISRVRCSSVSGYFNILSKAV